MPWKHCTNEGRVVYDRRPTPFVPNDLRRIARKMAENAVFEPPEADLKDIVALTLAIFWCFQLMESMVLWDAFPFLYRARRSFSEWLLKWRQSDPAVDLAIESETLPSHTPGR